MFVDARQCNATHEQHNWCVCLRDHLPIARVINNSLHWINYIFVHKNVEICVVFEVEMAISDLQS